MRMQVFRGLPRSELRAPCALTIGNFDGVHRGHQALLARVVAAARARNIAAAVMTFEPHPRELFNPERAPMRISSLRDKLGALAEQGIDRAIVQHFNRPFASLTAEAFVDLLISGCDARWLLVGDDFRFGARRTGDIALLQGMRSGVLSNSSRCRRSLRASSASRAQRCAQRSLPATSPGRNTCWAGRT